LDSIEAEELELFRTSVRRFMEREVVPNAERWRAAGSVDRSLWTRAGEAGLLLAAIPEEYGGGGGNFRHEVTIVEELARINFFDFGCPLHSAMVAPYILHYGTEEQKQRWLPRLASGELVGAIAMTEPSGGSDLQAIRTTAKRDGDFYLINGQKVFITNGQLANLIIVVVKTDPTAGGRGISLVCVETDGAEGFRRGRNLKKIGFEAQDTSELFFDDVRIPADHLIGGQPNQGFLQLKQQLPQERLIIAIQAVGAIESAIDTTLTYTRDRTAFGQSILDFQNTRFKLAEAATEAKIARVFLDHCIDEHIAGRLDDVTAAMAKWWASQKQCEIIDECLQLHGGFGYMAEYPIATMWTDARVQKIYGGTNEIMKEIIGRDLRAGNRR
jgi:acyl-CoA dehydrogenase